MAILFIRSDCSVALSPCGSTGSHRFRRGVVVYARGVPASPPSRCRSAALARQATRWGRSPIRLSRPRVSRSAVYVRTTTCTRGCPVPWRFTPGSWRFPASLPPRTTAREALAPISAGLLRHDLKRATGGGRHQVDGRNRDHQGDEAEADVLRAAPALVFFVEPFRGDLFGGRHGGLVREPPALFKRARSVRTRSAAPFACDRTWRWSRPRPRRPCSRSRRRRSLRTPPTRVRCRCRRSL